MFEVYYLPPTDPARETRIAEVVHKHRGWLDYREAPELDDSQNVCLTCEFDSLEDAETAAQEIRLLGEHAEGPYQYS